MAKRTSLKDRYELREVIGRGGMGVVYRALDTRMKREVALKTILDIQDPASVDLFYREWSILATMVHPNVIGIYDIGEFEEGGMRKPFFVMPMLPGVALDRLIRDGSPRLTTENVVNIIDQACRGLQAAHEQGLIHRDVKPSNIFVMDDDSVKIIDFGIARLASTKSNTGVKGTLHYLAPEFLEFQGPTPLSDQFALAVTAYEALTRRRPFDGVTESDVFAAIKTHTPPPASQLNPNVSFAISQVVHKGMAKQPYHRFATIRELGEALQKARRNEPLDLFDPSKIKPRLETARSSFERGDYGFALEVLTELESEGRLDQDIGLLRRQVDQAVRQTRIRQSLESARRFWEAAEYPLALRKIQEALDLDPDDADALTLKLQIERERREKKIEEWIGIARQHLANQAFSQAREALSSVLAIKPNDTVALALLAEAGRQEREVGRSREEKAHLYQAAMQAWDKGDITAALSRLEALMKLDRDLPDSGFGQSGTYHNFYNQVQSEHNSIRNAYDEARLAMESGNYEAALAVCRQYLSKYPNHALFQALDFDIEERQRQALSTVIAETDRRVGEEADLHRRVGILEGVLKLYPGEPHFERALKLVRDKRDLVNSIVSKARYFEERGQFHEALDQWQILRSIHERHPGLAFEIERLTKRRDQQARENAKAIWVQQTDRLLEAGEYERAVRTVECALAEFPGEQDLVELGNVAGRSLARSAEALELLAQAREAGEKSGLEASLPLLRQASELDPRNLVIRTVLVNSLLENSRRLIQIPDWEAVESVLKELLALDPSHPGTESLASEIAGQKREGFVSLCITQSRRFQAEGDIERALAVVRQGLQAYPNEPRFGQLQATLQRAQSEGWRPAAPRETVGARSDQLRDAAPERGRHRGGESASGPRGAVTGGSGIGDFDVRTGGAAANSTGECRSRTASNSPACDHPVETTGVAHLQECLVRGSRACLGGDDHPPRGGPCPFLPPAAASGNPVPGDAAVDSGRSRDPGGWEAVRRFLLPGSTACGELHGRGHSERIRGSEGDVFDRRGEGAVEIRLTLQPPPAHVSVSTDLTESTLAVDGTVVPQVQGGETEVPRLLPGPHVLEFQGGAAKATIALDFATGALPKLTSPIQASGIHAVIVSRYGSQAMVYSNTEGVPVMLDGKPAGTAGAAGLELKDLAAGQHELRASISGLTIPIPFESSGTAGLLAVLRTERKVVALRINTVENGVDVYLNGQKKGTTARGRWQTYVAPKMYVVHLEKPGLWAADQTVEARLGEDVKLTFQLVPAKGTLEVRGAPPGTEVWLDNAQIGVVKEKDEVFSSANIEPGTHTVSLRKEGFQRVQREYTFEPGKPVGMSGVLESAPARSPSL